MMNSLVQAGPPNSSFHAYPHQEGTKSGINCSFLKAMHTYTEILFT